MTRHRFDALSFVVGAACVGLAAAVLLQMGQLRFEDLRIAGPVALLALGLGALVNATTRGRGGATTDVGAVTADPTPAVEPTAATAGDTTGDDPPFAAPPGDDPAATAPLDVRDTEDDARG